MRKSWKNVLRPFVYNFLLLWISVMIIISALLILAPDIHSELVRTMVRIRAFDWIFDGSDFHAEYVNSLNLWYVSINHTVFVCCWYALYREWPRSLVEDAKLTPDGHRIIRKRYGNQYLGILTLSAILLNYIFGILLDLNGSDGPMILIIFAGLIASFFVSWLYLMWDIVPVRNIAITGKYMALVFAILEILLSIGATYSSILLGVWSLFILFIIPCTSLFFSVMFIVFWAKGTTRQESAI